MKNTPALSNFFRVDRIFEDTFRVEIPIVYWHRCCRQRFHPHAFTRTHDGRLKNGVK